MDKHAITLLVVSLVAIVLIMIAVFYFIVYYISPTERNTSWTAKIIVFIAFIAAIINIMMLPIDAANETVNGMNMPLAWKIMFWISIILFNVLCPMGLSFYDEKWLDDPRIIRKIFRALLASLATMIFVAVVGILLWIWSKAEVQLSAIQHNCDLGNMSQCTNIVSTIISFKASFTTYIIGVMAIIGYCLMLIYAGVGLFIWPFVNFHAFHHRPKPMKMDVFTLFQKNVRDRSEQLLVSAREMQTIIDRKKQDPKYQARLAKAEAKNQKRVKSNKTVQKVSLLPDLSMKEKKNLREINEQTESLRRDYDLMLACKGTKSYNPLYYYFRWFCGIIAFCLSGLWWCQMLLYMVTFLKDGKPVFDIFSPIMYTLSKAWGFLSLLFYAMMVFHFMLCLYTGLVKFGFRWLLFIPIFKLEKDHTTVPSFLFNAMVMNLASFGVIMFMSRAFRDYTVNSAVGGIFNEVIGNMKILKYVPKYGTWGIIGLSVLAFFIWLCIPSKKTDNVKKIETLLKKRGVMVEGESDKKSKKSKSSDKTK